jgi:hypothetical protein
MDLKMKISVLGGIAAAILATTVAQAIPVTGDIDFLGFSSTSVSHGVTTFSPDNSWLDIGGTGNYASTAGALLTVDSFSYTGKGTSAKLTKSSDLLWSFKLSGIAYSFDLTSLLDASVTSDSISLSGMGMAYETGYSATEAYWSLEGVGLNRQFDIDFATTDTATTSSGSGGSGSNIPDGGMTLVMLGLSLGACGLFARKFQPARVRA